jgi:hypothetical protein
MRNMLSPAASYIVQEEHNVFDNGTVGDCRSMVFEM